MHLPMSSSLESILFWLCSPGMTYYAEYYNKVPNLYNRKSAPYEYGYSHYRRKLAYTDKGIDLHYNYILVYNHEPFDNLHRRMSKYYF